MKLSVVIPCYNEVSTIERILQAVRASPWPDKEIIVVDDCSKDGTRERLAGETGRLADRVILHEVNRGKGAALRTGFQAATGDLVIVQDADLEYDPQEYPRLMAPIVEGHADVVYGSRFIGAHRTACSTSGTAWATGLLTLVSNMFTNLNLTDMETCYKVFRREVDPGDHDRGGPLRLRARDHREGARSSAAASTRCGISYYGRTYAEGKKIG